MWFLGLSVLFLMVWMGMSRSIIFLFVVISGYAVIVFTAIFSGLLSWMMWPVSWTLLPSWTSAAMDDPQATVLSQFGAVFLFPLDILRWSLDISIRQGTILQKVGIFIAFIVVAFLFVQYCRMWLSSWNNGHPMEKGYHVHPTRGYEKKPAREALPPYDAAGNYVGY